MIRRQNNYNLNSKIKILIKFLPTKHSKYTKKIKIYFFASLFVCFACFVGPKKILIILPKNYSAIFIHFSLKYFLSFRLFPDRHYLKISTQSPESCLIFKIPPFSNASQVHPSAVRFCRSLISRS